MDTSNTTNPAKKSPLGPVFGLIIILAIIIVGSVYFWGQKSGSDTATNTSDAQTDSLNKQDSSDETGSIEADLNATSFTNIDSGAEQLQ